MIHIRGGGRGSFHVWSLILLGTLLGCVACGQPETGGVAVGQPRELSQARGLQAASPVRLPEPPARAPAVRAWRETPSEDNALQLARSYFPELSEGLEPEARQVPVHPAAALRVKLADQENGELELATRGYVFRVRPQADSAATASRRVPGTTFYGPDHFWKAVGGQAVGLDGPWLTQRVEEFVVVRAGASAYRASYEVEVPEGIHTVRDAGEYLEFLDGGEVPVVRMHYPVARDEAGRGRQGKVRLWGATPRGSSGPGTRLALERRTLKVALEVGLEGLEGTVVVDPGWSATGSMATSRSRHTVQLLLNGKVLAAGGTDDSGGSPRSSAELYDPVTGTWSATSTRRASHTATLLPTGKVLMAGGYDGSTPLTSAELYDPATGSFSSTGSTAAPRQLHAAALLPDGKVLVVSGYNGGTTATGVLDSAEVYEESGAPDAWRPVVTSPSPLLTGKSLTVSGSGFRGISEASGGNAMSSAANLPFVSLTALEGGKRTAVSASGFSSTSVTVNVPPALVDGYYLLHVTTQAISGGAVVFVDGPPPAPVLTGPAALVNTATPTLSGTAEPGSTVTVSLDGTPVGTATADALGVWSLVVGSPLYKGPYTATAISVDGAGNTSPASEPRSFTVDATAPAAPFLTAPAAFVNATRPAISGFAEPGSTVAVKVDGTPVGTVTTNFSGDWSLVSTTPLVEGVHTATATATDAAGNTSGDSTARSFTVDTVAPAAPVLTAPAALITTSMPVISGTAEAGGMVEVKVDGVSVGTVSVNDSGSWILTAALGEGAHTATATVTDRAGNTSEASPARTFTVDTMAPVAPEVVTPAEGAAVKSGELLFSGTAEAGSTVTVSVDGLQIGTATADPSGHWSVNPVYETAQGRHTVTATATDAAGHASPASSGRSFTVEQEPQGCGCASSPAGGMASPLGLLALGFWVRRRRLLTAL
jgi:MYXO-CTERM domain-containing protein